MVPPFNLQIILPDRTILTTQTFISNQTVVQLLTRPIQTLLSSAISLMK